MKEKPKSKKKNTAPARDVIPGYRLPTMNAKNGRRLTTKNK